MGEYFETIVDVEVGEAPAVVACVRCGAKAGFNDWEWLTDFPFTVGFLGFKFWNWPPLSDALLAEFRERLGHRVVVTRGKL